MGHHRWRGRVCTRQPVHGYAASGDPDGLESTALVVQALNIQATATDNDPWYSGIMAAAEECGLIDPAEFTDASKPITRYEMARLAVRALAYKKEEIPSDYTDYASLVFDLNKSAAYREDINKVIAMGILSGWPGGSPERSTPRLLPASCG